MVKPFCVYSLTPVINSQTGDAGAAHSPAGRAAVAAAAAELSDTGTYTVETSGYRPRRPADYGDDLLWDSGFGRRSQRRGFVSDSEDEERSKAVVGKKRRLTVPSDRPAETKKDRRGTPSPSAFFH